MMTAVTVILVLILLFAGAVFYESLRELRSFEVTRYELRTSKLPKNEPEKKVVFLSDLHNWQYGPHNEELLRAVRRQHPDLILIGGDMLVGKTDTSYDTAVDFISQLPAIAPVYYANGNHEQRMKENPDIYGDVYAEYKNKLTKHKVKFLENETRYFFFGKTPVSVGGLEIPGRCYSKLKKAQLDKGELNELLGKADPDVYQILLAHHPVYADAYREWGADLILSGHLHGGIVRLPGIGGLVTPQVGLFPKYSGGKYKVSEGDLIVGRGLGTHTVNLRFCNPAELVVITLKGE